MEQTATIVKISWDSVMIEDSIVMSKESNFSFISSWFYLLNNVTMKGKSTK